jgi:hypothetical protein
VYQCPIRVIRQILLLPIRRQRHKKEIPLCVVFVMNRRRRDLQMISIIIIGAGKKKWISNMRATYFLDHKRQLQMTY